MRKLIFFFFLLSGAQSIYGQGYIPMPVDTAVWRYRFVDIDNYIQCTDNILYINGTDTTINGLKYKKVFSRSAQQIVSSAYGIPVINTYATSPSIYYAAIRENNKQVFIMQSISEKMIFDFNVSVGDSIPAFSGKDKVTATDDVLLSDGLYHKRYLTNDTGYYVIEGVGSNRGLIPFLLDPAITSSFFMCHTHLTLTYTPRTDIPCTYIYPFDKLSVPTAPTSSSEVNVYPVPARDEIHIMANDTYNSVVFDCSGRMMWHDVISGHATIPISQWPVGVYYMRLTSASGNFIKKLIVE